MATTFAGRGSSDYAGPCGALARSRLGARTVISRKAYCPLWRRAFAPGLATGLRLRLLRWWLNHLQLRRTGWFLRLTCRSAGRFQLWRGQDRRSDGRRQRCDVFPAWRQLHVGDDRSGQRLKRGQTGIGNAYGLKQSIKTHGEARGDGTIQAKMDAQPGTHPVILLSIRARHGRRTPPDSFRSTKLCTRADAAWMARGEIRVTPNISRGRRCRRPPSSKKRIDSTCSGALPACRWSQGRPPASRSWRRGHI